jgi:hypothetical protein
MAENDSGLGSSSQKLPIFQIYNDKVEREFCQKNVVLFVDTRIAFV